MTFSIAGRCARTGMFGVAITTSSICVGGGRCPHARAKVGAVATQNITDPTFGPRILDLLAKGHDADDALTRAIAGRPHLDFRQIPVIDDHGATASYTGNHILGTNSVAVDQGCIAAGNLLRSIAVPAAMTDAFAANRREHLAERLLRALEAGLQAGGEAGPFSRPSGGRSTALRAGRPQMRRGRRWPGCLPASPVERLRAADGGLSHPRPRPHQGAELRRRRRPLRHDERTPHCVLIPLATFLVMPGFIPGIDDRRFWQGREGDGHGLPEPVRQ
jgi:hypothetical protein